MLATLVRLPSRPSRRSILLSRRGRRPRPRRHRREHRRRVAERRQRHSPFSAIPLDDRVDVRRVATDDDLRWGSAMPTSSTKSIRSWHQARRPSSCSRFRSTRSTSAMPACTPSASTSGRPRRRRATDARDNANRRAVASRCRSAGSGASRTALATCDRTCVAARRDAAHGRHGRSARTRRDAHHPGGGTRKYASHVGGRPDLLTTVATMTDGYGVTAPDGTTTEGAGAADAESWQEAYAAATDGDQVFLLPYANPDLPAIASAGEDVATESASEAPRRYAGMGRTGGVTGPARLPGPEAVWPTMPRWRHWRRPVRTQSCCRPTQWNRRPTPFQLGSAPDRRLSRPSSPTTASRQPSMPRSAGPGGRGHRVAASVAGRDRTRRPGGR